MVDGKLGVVKDDDMLEERFFEGLRIMLVLFNMNVFRVGSSLLENDFLFMMGYVILVVLDVLEIVLYVEV